MSSASLRFFLGNDVLCSELDDKVSLDSLLDDPLLPLFATCSACPKQTIKSSCVENGKEKSLRKRRIPSSDAISLKRKDVFDPLTSPHITPGSIGVTRAAGRATSRLRSRKESSLDDPGDRIESALPLSTSNYFSLIPSE